MEGKVWKGKVHCEREGESEESSWCGEVIKEMVRDKALLGRKWPGESPGTFKLGEDLAEG